MVKSDRGSATATYVAILLTGSNQAGAVDGKSTTWMAMHEVMTQTMLVQEQAEDAMETMEGAAAKSGETGEGPVHQTVTVVAAVEVMRR